MSQSPTKRHRRSLHCEYIAPLLPLMPLGELSEDDAARVRDHLITCAWCQQEVAAYQLLDKQVRNPSATSIPVEVEERLNSVFADVLSSLKRGELADSAHSAAADTQPPAQGPYSSELASVIPSAYLMNTRGPSYSRSRRTQVAPLVTLNDPDPEEGHIESAYSDIQACRLVMQYSAIKRHDYTCALSDALASQRLPMSRRQQLRTLYVIGMSLVGLGQPLQALDALDEAIDIANEIDEIEAIPKLFYLSASIYGERQELAMAVENYKSALEAFQQVHSRSYAPDAELELEILSRLAGHSCILARYDDAHTYLEQARKLASCVHSPEILGMLEWVHALVLRWRGRSEDAYRHAGASVELYDSWAGVGARISQGRIRIVFADCALDLANIYATSALPASSARDSFIDIASAYSRVAQDIACSVDDEAGVALATLAQARCQIMLHQELVAIVAAEQVLTTAQRLNDVPLLAQAFSLMGEAFDSCGRPESARTCYRKTLDSLAYSDASALGMRARRALLIASEYETNPLEHQVDGY